ATRDLILSTPKICGTGRPRVRDVLGTLLLTTLSGARPRMHINLPRYEPVNPRLLRHAQSVQ
ncbi:MAG: hypothetical protein OXN89_05925, partial [Bryobacterales bacterium]|nr:hypothetical protein [Bryobacterales bacterium]